MLDKVFDGPEVGLVDMLDAREGRSLDQKRLLEEADEGMSLLSVGLNIPGPVKTSVALRNFFDYGLVKLDELLTGKVLTRKVDYVNTGDWAFYLVDMPGDELKTIAISFEEDNSWGRLLDLDVLIKEGGLIKGLSRSDYNLPARKCLVCSEPAKECGRSRKHTIEEMQEAICEMLV